MLNLRSTWAYLIKQGYSLTKQDWLNLNVEGFLDINLAQEDKDFIFSQTKVGLSNKGITVC